MDSILLLSFQCTQQYGLRFMASSKAELAVPEPGSTLEI